MAVGVGDVSGLFVPSQGEAEVVIICVLGSCLVGLAVKLLVWFGGNCWEERSILSFGDVEKCFSVAFQQGQGIMGQQPVRQMAPTPSYGTLQPSQVSGSDCR